MSVVSSVLSTGSSRWKINDRLASIMDSIFAIGAGLGVRFIVDAATHQNMKLTSSLIGLWEGVVLLHFLKKMPRSNDPYIAYGVRLFVDFLVTESVARFVVVLIWTGMGMVLADIGPALWDDAGLKQVWRRFRRDMRTVSKVIPTVAFFPPARTVRFSPSLAPTETMGSDPPTPSAFTITEMTPTTNPSVPLPPTTTDFTTPKRRVPGYFPSGFSDTDSLTSIGSPLPIGRRIPSSGDPTRTSRRLSVYPSHLDDSDASSQNENDLDEANLSSSASDSDSTEIAAPSASGPIDTENIPEMDVEEEPPIQISTEPTKPEEEADPTTPRSRPVQMPPTPSDSAARWDRDLREHDEPLGPRPKSELLPQIPDFLEEPASEDWETIKKQDYVHEKELPPTPSEKDLPEGGQAKTTPAPEPAAGGAPPPEEEGWDTMQSQFLGNDNDETKKPNDTVESQDANPTTNTHDQPPLNRGSLPPPYEDDFDDMYGDEALPEKPAGTSNDANWLDQEEARSREQEEKERILREEEEERSRKAALEEAERLEKVEEERKKAEEAERLKNEEEAKAAAERLKTEEEEKRREKEEKRKKKEEAAERKRKEEADEAVRQKKREDDAAEEKRLKDEAAEKKRLEDEAAEKKRLEDEAAERKRLEDEAAEKKRLEDEATEKMRLEDEAAERKRLEDEAAERKQRLDDEAAAAAASEAARLADEEAERQRLAEEENQRQQEEKRQQQELQEVAEAAVAAALEAEGADAAKAIPSNLTDGPAHSFGNEQQQQEDEQHPDPFSPAEPPITDLNNQPDQPEYEESVASEVSEAPGKVQERLERVLFLKAQMVEIESQIQFLKAQVTSATAEGDATTVADKTAELQHTEKVLRKFQRKEQRRWGNGPEGEVPSHIRDMADAIFLEGMGHADAKKRVQEKLEELLGPGARSLKLTINYAKAKRGKDQLKGSTDIVVKLVLLDYTHTSGGVSRIDVPAEDFGTWLTAYRIAATREESDEHLW